MGKFFIDKEILEKEELEAQEKGLTVLQLRQLNKLHEQRRERIRKEREKKKLERLKKIEREKNKLKKQKEREKLKKEKQKELLKQKNKEKKEKEKLKRQQWLLEHPQEKPKKKRPVGRPKKRGPKKKYKRKKKIIIEKKYNEWNYKIISCINGRQNGFIGKYLNTETAYEKLNSLMEENKSVIFPSKIIHGEGGNKIQDSKYEYLLLERKTNNDSIPLLRNEFGKLVEQHSNSENWNIIDKRKYYPEETFWVWGFNNKTERKTFPWIYENILLARISNSYDIKRIILYKNKIIIKNDDESMDIIFCKTKSDAFRFYQLLENKIKEDKIKQVFFIGSYDTISDKRRKLEEQLMEMTGWTKKKIQMSSTSEHKKLDF